MTLILSLYKDNKQLELEKRNTLILSIAQGLSVTTTNINMINTGLVGTILATHSSYATIPLSLQFLTIALTLIPVSLLMGKFGRRPMFLVGAMSAFIGCLIIACAIYYKLFVLLNHSVPIHEEYYYKKGVGRNPFLILFITFPNKSLIIHNLVEKSGEM